MNFSHYLTPILRSVSNGLPLRYAAVLHGVYFDQFQRWAETQPLFRLQLLQAQAINMSRTLHKLSRASRHWQAHAWKLERLYPETFALVTKEQAGASTPTSTSKNASQETGIPQELCEQIEKGWQNLEKQFELKYPDFTNLEGKNPLPFDPLQPLGSTGLPHAGKISGQSDPSPPQSVD